MRTGLCSLLAAAAAGAQASKPHVVMVLVDDNGWAGVGYNNPHVNTPNLDKLAAGGLKLTSQYVYRYCAPTRASFLTGRYPYKLAATRANFIPWTLTDGTHLGYSMLPKKLASAGYYSVHVGKWHQGLYTPEYTPVGRGFNHSFGFLEGGEDHNTSRTFGNYCKKDEVDLSYGKMKDGSAFPYEWPACDWQELGAVAVHEYVDSKSVDVPGYNPFSARYDSEEGCRRLCEERVNCAGYSWRAEDTSHPHYHQCFLVSAVGQPAPADSQFKSALCIRRNASQPTTLAAVGKNGTYTGVLFSDEAVRVIDEHDPSVPLFMYYAMHDTHAPLEVPYRFRAQYSHFNDEKREIFSGMLSFVDESVANVTAALHRTGMWQNTLLIWTNDNGSPIYVGGSNHPLRGGKGTNWEGGTRVPAFVTGGLLPSAMAGRVHDGMIHIADWHVTISKLAGLDPAAGEPNAPSPLDGMDVWPWVSGAVAKSSRNEIVYDHRMYDKATSNTTTCYNVSGRCLTGAYRVGDWKLVVGPEKQNDWFGWFSPNVTDPVTAKSPSVTTPACFADRPCLFNLTADIGEHADVADQHPTVVADMLAKWTALQDTYHPPQHNPPADLDGYCAAITLNRGYVGPWMQQPSL